MHPIRQNLLIGLLCGAGLAWGLTSLYYERAPNPSVRAIDGDTLVLGGERIRLAGIDAPELHQDCQDSSGNAYPCGRRSADYLEDLASAGPVTCDPLGKDRYGRTLATCTVNGQDLGSQMVSAGWALAYTRYSSAYTPEQEYAQKNGSGVWSGSFDAPETFRHRR